MADHCAACPFAGCRDCAFKGGAATFVPEFRPADLETFTRLARIHAHIHGGHR